MVKNQHSAPLSVLKHGATITPGRQMSPQSTHALLGKVGKLGAERELKLIKSSIPLDL